MGSVYEAEDLRLGRCCAVKVLREHLASRPSARRRFDREASLLGRLAHENIVALIDAGVAGEFGAYLVLEYLRGRTLRTEFQESGVRSVDRILEIVTQVARGLGYAHGEGVVHRDLKPENIMLTRHADGRLLVKLLDFGIARQHDGAMETVTATDTAIGTAAYMAPEQARGEKVLTAATDIYALGAVVYEALAGRRPYDGGSYNETLFQILNGPHKPLAELRPDLSPDLCLAVERALEKSSEARFPTALDFAKALGANGGTLDLVPDSAQLAGTDEATALSASVARPASLAAARRRFGWGFVMSGIGGAALGTLATTAFYLPARPTPTPAVVDDAAHVRAAAPPLATPGQSAARPAPARTAAPIKSEETLPAPVTAAAAPPRAPEPRTQRSAPSARSRAAAAPSAEAASGRPSAEPKTTSVGAFPKEPAEEMPSGYIVASPYAHSEANRGP